LTLNDSKAQSIRIRGSRWENYGQSNDPNKTKFSPERLDLHRLGILRSQKRFD